MAAQLYTVGQVVSIEALNLYINRVATYLINPAVKGLTCWLDASSPIFGALVQLVRMPACHAGGHGFKSRTHRQYSLMLRSY